MQADLFAVPPPSSPAGLAFREDLLTIVEETALIAAINALPLSPFRFQGWLGKRLTHSFGWSYDFDTGEVAGAPPMPDWLLPVRQKAADFAGIAAADLVQSLVIRYDPGAGIGWHRDRPLFEDVVGVSLGAPAILRLRHRTGTGFERQAVPIPPRSVYLLRGDARHRWEHSIVPMTQSRWSITFRSLSEQGRRLLHPRGVADQGPMIAD